MRLGPSKAFEILAQKCICLLASQNKDRLIVLSFLENKGGGLKVIIVTITNTP